MLHDGANFTETIGAVGVFCLVTMTFNRTFSDDRPNDGAEIVVRVGTVNLDHLDSDKRPGGDIPLVGSPQAVRLWTLNSARGQSAIP